MRARGCAAEPGVSRTRVSAATRAARNCPRAHAAQTPRPRMCLPFLAQKLARPAPARDIGDIPAAECAPHSGAPLRGGVPTRSLSSAPSAPGSIPVVPSTRPKRWGGVPRGGSLPAAPPLPDGKENGVAVTFSCKVGAGSMVVTAALPAPQIPRPGQGSPPLRRPLATASAADAHPPHRISPGCDRSNAFRGGGVAEGRRHRHIARLLGRAPPGDQGKGETPTSSTTVT